METKKFLKIDQSNTFVVEVERSGKNKQVTKAQFLVATEVGLTIALPIVGSALLGLGLDNKFKTHPRFTIGLLILGTFISFVNLYKIVKDFSKK